MGCGCGKNKNTRRQSSRMKSAGNDINLPPHMSPNDRRANITKMSNARKAKQEKTSKDWEKFINENL